MRRAWMLVPFAAALLGSSPAPAQDPSGAPLDRAKVLAVAREIMAKARFATLVTIGEDGHPQARVVDPFPPEDEMTVWLGTKSATRKVPEIRRDGRVALSYFDPQAMSYATLVGTAEVVTDPTEKSKRWKDAWATLYRDRNRGEDYLLIRIRPTRLEVVSVAQGLVNDPVTWRPPMISFPPNPARHH